VPKYNNKKEEINGIVFDSKLEAEYYRLLLQQQKEGLITHIVLQPVYLLIPSFKKKGKTIRRAEYIADFLITYKDGSQAVIDVKGMATDVFKLKAKLFNYSYPDLELKVITKQKGEWIELGTKAKRGKVRVKKNRL
jgi:hypothetical protein